MRKVVAGATSDRGQATCGRQSTLRRAGCGWCDERHATGDVRATIDASTRDRKNSRSTKATFCQNMASITFHFGKKSVCVLEHGTAARLPLEQGKCSDYGIFCLFFGLAFLNMKAK